MEDIFVIFIIVLKISTFAVFIFHFGHGFPYFILGLDA